MNKITSINQELETRIDWLEKGLQEFVDGEIFKDVDNDELIDFIKDISCVILDGEPTTADEDNEEDLVVINDDGQMYNPTNIKEKEEIVKEVELESDFDPEC